MNRQLAATGFWLKRWMSRSETVFRPLFVALLLVFTVQSETSAGLLPAVTTMQASCLHNAEFVEDAAPGSLSCHRTIDSPFGITTASAEASSLGQSVPGLIISSAIETNDELITPAITAASGWSLLRYWFRVQVIEEPPFSVGNVPVSFRTVGSIDRQGETFSFGFLGAMNQGGIFHGIDVNEDTSLLNFERTNSYPPGYQFQVWLELYCESIVDGPGASSCFGAVSATLSLNQELFDEQYGNNSFVLSDYFSIELSPHLVAVPLPAALWLFLSAVSGLFLLSERAQPVSL